MNKDQYLKLVPFKNFMPLYTLYRSQYVENYLKKYYVHYN